MNLHHNYFPGVQHFEDASFTICIAVGNDVWYHTGCISLQRRAIFTLYLYRDPAGTGRRRFYDDLCAANWQSNLAQEQAVMETLHHIRNFRDSNPNDKYRLIPAVPFQRDGGDLDHG